MFSKNKKIISAVLVIVIVLLISFAGYITLFSSSTTEETSLQTHKVKASTQTYTKTLVLNNPNNDSNNSSVTDIPGSTLAPITAIPSPTVTSKAGIGGVDAQPLSPSPTEIILGYKNPPLSPTVGPSIDPTTLAATGMDNSSTTGNASSSAATPSTTVTKLKSLPKTGLFQNTLIMFAVSSTLIFVAFLF